ncbi:MAG: hypothetical protein WAT23_02350 [Chromatiaceae bacterium]
MSLISWSLLAYVIVGACVVTWASHKDKKEGRIDIQGVLLDIEARTDPSFASSSASAIGTVLGYLVGTLFWPLTVRNLLKERRKQPIVSKSFIEEVRIIRTPEERDLN